MATKSQWLKRILSFSILPTNEVFYELFGKQIEIINKASTLLVELMDSKTQKEQRVILYKRIKDAEEAGDALSREVQVLTSESITTPFSRDDINRLRNVLDDIIDGILNAADDYMAYYQLLEYDGVPQEIHSMSLIIRNAAEAINDLIPHLRKFNHPSHIYQRIRDFEHQADEINKLAIPHYYLMANNSDDWQVNQSMHDRAHAFDKVITRMEQTADTFRHAVNEIVREVIAKRV